MPPGRGHIVFELHELEGTIRRFRDMHMRQLENDGAEQPSVMQHWVIGYLIRHDGENIYQRDIEKEFRISPSATSMLLKQMEAHGLIERRSVPDDARLKKLAYTKKAADMHERDMDCFSRMDEYVDGSITPEEKDIFLDIVHKLGASMLKKIEEDTQN